MLGGVTAAVLGAGVVGLASARTADPVNASADHTVATVATPWPTSATVFFPTGSAGAGAGAGSGGATGGGAPAQPSPQPTTISGEASALAADGIPATALLAYQQAAAAEQLVDPACALSWPLLAGIGRVESDHGRFAGAVLYTNGISVPRIIGIPLDGNGTALILDTDHGRLDGDTVYDHAVGPMQFIPSTWATYGLDGNHDGVADPFNIFDAARTAAAYLCSAGVSLATLAGQTEAVLTYNHSDAYVALVLSVEAAYAQGVPGLTVPVLPPAGPAPAAPAPGIPPADPGSALGVPAGGAVPSASASTVKSTPASAPASAATSHATTTGAAPSSSGPPTPSASVPPTTGPPSTPAPVTPAAPPTSPPVTSSSPPAPPSSSVIAPSPSPSVPPPATSSQPAPSPASSTGSPHLT